MKLKQLEDKLIINEHALDVALREHPDLFYRVATELAIAVSNRDAAKMSLEKVEAMVDMDLRADAAKIGAKTTEKEIESNKKVDKTVIAANENFLSERYNAAKWTALREAYEQRSYALSKLVDLYLANYYSSQEDKKTGAPDFRTARAEHIKEENRRKRVGVE
jgi:hypothetical protein